MSHHSARERGRFELHKSDRRRPSDARGEWRICSNRRAPQKTIANASLTVQESESDQRTDSAPVEVEDYHSMHDFNLELRPPHWSIPSTVAMNTHDGENIKCKTVNTSDPPDSKAEIKLYREWHDYDSRAIHDTLQQAARKAQWEQAAHEAEKQKARKKSEEMSKEWSKVWLGIQEAKKKDKAAKVRMQETEKSEEEAEKTIRQMERNVRELEKKAWEKRAWRGQMNFRKSVERNGMQKEWLQINETRAQRAEDRASDAWSRVEEMKIKVQKAEEDLEYES